MAKPKRRRTDPILPGEAIKRGGYFGPRPPRPLRKFEDWNFTIRDLRAAETVLVALHEDCLRQIQDTESEIQLLEARRSELAGRL